jgi:hypothetical protein
MNPRMNAGACIWPRPQFRHPEVLLWFHRPIHQGSMTSYPLWSSVACPLPNQKRWYRPRTFYPSVGSRWERPTFSWKRTMKANRLSLPEQSA